MAKATFRIWRGDAKGGELRDYVTEAGEGMVVLDAVHAIQADQANDMAVRWNCKAGKCGSCSAEINGMPKLMCMTRLDTIDTTKAVTIEPMRAFPPVKDLISDVSWNFDVKKRIKKFNPRPPDAEDGTWRMQQEDIDRVQEFRKCIECFLCQDVCHVLRDHVKHDEFIGPRFLVYTAALDASARHRKPHRGAKGRIRHRLLQHHKMLHKGLSREHNDHRQRHHSAKGARRRRALRPADAAGQVV